MKQPGLKNGNPKEHSEAVKTGMKSYTCEHCGVMLSPADDPHNCPKQPWCPVHNSARPCIFCQDEDLGTGTTIAEEQAKVQTIGDLRDEIVEAAVGLTVEAKTGESALIDAVFIAVDAYHSALRQASREGK